MIAPRRLGTAGRRGAPALLALGLLVAACDGGRDAAPPSVLLLSMDTTRRDHLPFYGYARDTAPRWSELARAGVVFDDAVAVNTNTAPSHASMLSGLYPGQHGIRNNGGFLRREVRLLPDLLRERGYASAAFVSAATLTARTGLARGFDLYRETYDPEERQVTGDVTVAAARAWLAERAGDQRPFFLLVHLYDPHFPYRPHPELERELLGPEAPPAPPENVVGMQVRREHQERVPVDAALARRLVARYDAEIRYADGQSALLLDDLERLGLAGRTLVVWLSDHGETLFEREWVCDHGARVFDEQIRIPLVLRFGDGRAAGRRVGAPVSHVDLAPTILELAGVAPPIDLPGRSLLPLLERESAEDRARPTFSSSRAATQRIPQLGEELKPGLVYSVRASGRKVIRYPGKRRTIWQLFDLERDPGERASLTGPAGAELIPLQRTLVRWQQATGSDATPAERSADAQTAADLRALGYLD